MKRSLRRQRRRPDDHAESVRKLNASTLGMMPELIAAFDRADADNAVRAVIVTGAGRGFCAGADLSGGAKAFDHEARADRPDRRAPKRDAFGQPAWSAAASRRRPA